MQTRLSPHAAYRDSGLSWLGAVPSHWKVTRAKTVLRSVDVRSVTGEEEMLTVSSQRGVVPRSTAKVTMFQAESYVGHKLCWPGDLVINSLWAWSRGLGVSAHHGIVSSAYGVYRPRGNSGLEPRFVHHLARSSPFHWELRVRSKGVWTSRLQLTDDAFLDAPLPIPPTEEQALIVRYLDDLDRRVSQFIQNKRRLISLLGEEKTAVIEHAVTRGVDPKVKLTTSVLDWLDEMPAHYRTSRLKFETAAIVDCLHATPQYIPDGPYLAIRTADVEPGRVRLQQAKHVGAEEFALWTARLRPRVGDILYSREGERFGIAAPVPAGVELCISQRMMVFRIKESENSTYMMWQLNCRHVYQQAAVDNVGSAAPHVNIERIKNYRVLVPPAEEQRAIVEQIERDTAGLDRAVAAAEREIELIREYRTRLVADVVTGKLDVREAAASLPDSDDLNPLDDLALEEADELDEDVDVSA